MIVGGQTEARSQLSSTIIDYHEPFDQGFRCSSGHVLSKTKSVTPHFFYISDTTYSSSFNSKVFRKKITDVRKFSRERP